MDLVQNAKTMGVFLKLDVCEDLTRPAMRALEP